MSLAPTLPESPLPAQTPRTVQPMTAAEELAVRAWLALIGETDAAIVADVVSRCQQDADARDYFIRRAADELARPDLLADDRRTCPAVRAPDRPALPSGAARRHHGTLEP